MKMPRRQLTAICAKTRMCKYFSAGACLEGQECKFAHGTQEMRAAPNLLHTKPCKHFLRGRCVAGVACTFAHGEAELRQPTHTSTGSSGDALGSEGFEVFELEATSFTTMEEQLLGQEEHALTNMRWASMRDGGAHTTDVKEKEKTTPKSARPQSPISGDSGMATIGSSTHGKVSSAPGYIVGCAPNVDKEKHVYRYNIWIKNTFLTLDEEPWFECDCPTARRRSSSLPPPSVRCA
eukprot:TRINITY_DN92560_c0_g1_i1.p1 TRINITY_DN92560_c0_g1~~TRINITY_DN92560_c0_g1_i1.p1  ORF type:complete len:236 (+),score=38.33 TRINITY_DN92560_c0_g1_i1:86-793(+)